MATGLNPSKERIYVLEEDRDLPEEEQTKWYYRLLPSGAYYAAQDSLIEVRGIRGDSETRTAILSGTQERDALLSGLVRVENFFDEDGRPLHWPEAGREARMDFLSTMLPRHRQEIARAITGESTLDTQEKKALPSPSGSA